jgi:hypothetical protein
MPQFMQRWLMKYKTTGCIANQVMFYAVPNCSEAIGVRGNY